MSPEASLMPPEGCRGKLKGRGRHNVARGRHIFQWPESRGVILTLIYKGPILHIHIVNDIGFNIVP